jgi:hypothetical protein
VSNLRSCGPLAYSDNECGKQLLYALDDSVWGMKITTLEEFADFATIDTEKLFSKLKSHELCRKCCPNHDASHTSKAFITSARVDDHDANPTNITVSYTLEFILSSLIAASNEQYESIPDNEIALLVRMFRKERRKSPRGCFECGDTTHFITDCSKRKKIDSSYNKYDLLELLLLVSEAVILLVALSIVVLIGVVILVRGVKPFSLGAVSDEVGYVASLEAAPIGSPPLLAELVQDTKLSCQQSDLIVGDALVLLIIRYNQRRQDKLQSI